MTPNRVINTSSYHAVYGSHPALTSFKPFGCRAFWLDPDQNKLQPKASAGIYVRTAGGGFTVLNPQSGRTVIRRDVRFQEFDFPLVTKVTVLTVTSTHHRIVHDALNGPKADN